MFASSEKELLEKARSNGIEFADIRFTDITGMMQHFTVPLKMLDESSFTFGIGFDGSSIRGWKNIDESDMLAKLDFSSAYVDPFLQHKTIAIIADIYEPGKKGGQPHAYSRDPRFILRKAIEYMKSTNIADKALFGPEAEFFIFNDIRYDQKANEGFYFIDSDEAAWNTGRIESPNLGYKIRRKEGYFPLPPNDQYQDLRSEMLHLLEKMGIATEKHHHEVASAGQAEINLVADECLAMADKIQLYKYVVKNVARQAGFTATFMPKPIFGDNGSGMHTHQSLWKGNTNLFSGELYAHMSETALHYIAGILHHGPALLAFTNPTTNSYKRLVPGYEAPVNLVYSARNRSASIRIPVAVSDSPSSRRIEFRTPDPSCNVYLAFAAMIMAGINGIQNGLMPGEPCDYNLYEASPEQKAKIKSVPANLTKVLDALEEDHSWLTAGEVFDKDFIDKYIAFRRNEIEQIVNLRPHPYEFMLYYDC